MYLGRVGYYADFVIYPVLVLFGGAIILTHIDEVERVDWLVAVAAGLALWTFLEYAMHRIVLHRIVFFDRMHDVHHHAPTEKIGTPSWLSLGVVAFGIFGPCYLGLGPLLGSGVTAGIMIGYLWYISVHHAVHHWRLDHAGYLYRAKRRHAQHHHTHVDRNYGVTTPLWDKVFRSTLVGPSSRPDAQKATHASGRRVVAGQVTRTEALAGIGIDHDIHGPSGGTRAGSVAPLNEGDPGQTTGR
jgi:sterol desaturase/sphingolipid hydroxylase (fatty acid hydroxylase superfamily)